MPGKIFISYRRDDSRATAGRIYDRLAQALGKASVFMDVDSIPPGGDFVSILDSFIARSDVLLVIIGPRWLAARGEDGMRRLDAADDFVRIEVAGALRQSKRIIPVLVDHAAMPQAGELPEEIAGLARLQAMEVRHNRFGADVNDLITAVRGRADGNRWSVMSLAAGTALLIGLGAGGAVWWSKTVASEQDGLSRSVGSAAAARPGEASGTESPGAAEARMEARVAAEVARIQAEQKAEDERRRDAAERQRQADARRQAEDAARKAEEARKVAEAKLEAEIARKAAEAQRQAEVRQQKEDERRRAAQRRAEEVARAYDIIQENVSVGVLEAFVERYPDTVYADMARARIKELRTPATEGATVSGERKVAALTSEPSGRASGSIAGRAYDGIWVIDRSTPRCVSKGSQFTVIIRDGKVNNPLKKGMVQSDGVVSFAGPSPINNDVTAEFSGRLAAGRGNGRVAIARGGRVVCEGTFTMTRKSAATGN